MTYPNRKQAQSVAIAASLHAGHYAALIVITAMLTLLMATAMSAAL